jgi:hypothetical protein
MDVMTSLYPVFTSFIADLEVCSTTLVDPDSIIFDTVTVVSATVSAILLSDGHMGEKSGTSITTLIVSVVMTLEGEMDTVRGLSVNWACLWNVLVELVADFNPDVTVTVSPDVVS